MAVALSSSDKDVIERQIETAEDDNLYDDTKVNEIFEVDRCVEWVREKELAKVTLQFPDSLMKYAPRVAMEMEERMGMRFAILGDTSYGECCVDEVAAEHIGADGVIHFGNTCLTPTQRLPVLFVYTCLTLDTERLLEELKQLEEGSRVHLFYDVRYHEDIKKNSSKLSHLHLCTPTEPDFSNDSIKCARLCPEPINEGDTIVYCGDSDKYALMLALTFNKQRHYAFSGGALRDAYPKIGKELMKRYYLIEKAKDAERVGVLVGTLGVTRYQDVIDRVTRSVRDSGKKAYTFLVGKPNVPKLANFPEVDVFVLIACPENSVVGSKDFLQPVITPFELDVALNAAREWTGEFSANFQDLLPGKKDFKEFERPEEGQGDVSLITGRVRQVGLGPDRPEVASSTALMEQETAVGVLHQGGGGQFLAERSWQGLEQALGETKVEKATKGRKGIAFGYEGEGN